MDLLRLLASLQMIHGHTLDALMAEELRSGVVFERWSWGRGLVSVAFMVAAGVSFHLSTLARFERHVGDRGAVRRRLRRGAGLVVLGYLLHFPAGLFGGDAAAATQALHAFQIADVLQCIGLSLLALEGLTLLVKDPRHVVWASAGLAVLLLSLAPLGERVSPDGPWRFAVNYVTHQGGSLFPLLPWAGYVFVGVVVGQLALPQGTRTSAEVPLRRLLFATAVVLTIALVAELVPFTLVTAETSRNAHPAFNLEKLGTVLAILSVLALVGQRIEKLPPFLSILAGESLALYVFHLMVIYGGGVGLYRLIGRTLPLPVAALVAAAMIVVTGAVALLWFRVKRWNRARRSSS